MPAWHLLSLHGDFVSCSWNLNNTNLVNFSGQALVEKYTLCANRFSMAICHLYEEVTWSFSANEWNYAAAHITSWSLWASRSHIERLQQAQLCLLLKVQVHSHNVAAFSLTCPSESRERGDMPERILHQSVTLYCLQSAFLTPGSPLEVSKGKSRLPQ